MNGHVGRDADGYGGVHGGMGFGTRNAKYGIRNSLFLKHD